MKGRLYIVATPIGNLEDITERALRVLSEADVIACEDTRRTKILLNHFGIRTATISYHEHNEVERAAALVQRLENGKNVAVVSDAGTPLISDPGFRLVNHAIERGLEVVPIPGPSAFVTALVASGLPSDKFFFAGFLPARSTARRAQLQELVTLRATLIFYEAPHRINATLRDAAEIFGNRSAAVARELTKLHEEVVRGNLIDLAKRFSAESGPRGEIVLIVSGVAAQASSGENDLGRGRDLAAELIARIRDLENQGMTAKQALKQAARDLGLKRDEAYRRLVLQKNRRNK